MELDALHDRLFKLLEQALALPAPLFGPAYLELVDTVDADFGHEEDLLESVQSEQAQLHREQHARMQAGLHHAAAALEQGHLAPARKALQDLRDWLPLHIESMDRQLMRRADGSTSA